MNKSAKLAELRHFLARYGLPPDRTPMASGSCRRPMRCWAAGCGPARCMKSSPRAGAPAALPCCWRSWRRAQGKPLFWVRPDYEALEYGALSPNGLLELGGDPASADPGADAAMPPMPCRPPADILACPHVGALLLEIEGMPKCLDLVASRRLAFAAGESGVTAHPVAQWRGGRTQRRADPLAGGERALRVLSMMIGAIRSSTHAAHPSSRGRAWANFFMNGIPNMACFANHAKRRILALWLPRLPTDRLIRRAKPSDNRV